MIFDASAKPEPLIDPFGRAITYVRVSVTDRCDFRCVYCMAEDMTFLPKKDVLSLEELDRLCSAFVERGVRKIRLTGGEPLVRKNIMSLVRSLSRHIRAGDLDELTLTTNGSQLARFADELAECGVKRINVSVDTLDPAKFKAVTRWGELGKVMDGIEAARHAGLKVKINAVALKGVNEHEFDDLIRWTHGAGMDLTLIETMPLGEIDGDRTDQYLPLSLVRCGAVQALDARGHPLQDRRTGALCADRRDRRPAGLHHAAHPQFLRRLQPRPRHLHRHALHVPRPGGRRRSARAAPRFGGERSPPCGDRRSDLAEAEGPRLHHRPRASAAGCRPAHERDGRIMRVTSIIGGNHD